MRRSKLETYVDMLHILALRGPQKLTHVMYKANLNSKVTKENLDFLIQKGLVEERPVKKGNAVYSVTQNGLNVVKYFRELQKALPLVEESRVGASHFC